MGLEHCFWTGDDYWSKESTEYQIRPRTGAFVSYFERRDGKSMHAQSAVVELADIEPLMKIAREADIEAEFAVIWARRQLEAGHVVSHYSSW